MEAAQSHAALPAEEADLPKFMVAEISVEPSPELLAQFAQAFAHALACGIISDPNESGVAGIVAVGNDIVRAARFCNKAIEQVIMPHGLAQPKDMPVDTDQEPQQGIGNTGEFIFPAPRLLCGAGIMNIADNCQGDGLSHADGFS